MNGIATKAEIRKAVKAMIVKMTEEEKIKQSNSVCRQIIMMEEYQRANSIAVFLNMSLEIGTKSIIEDAFKSGKKVYVPVIYDKKMKLVSSFGLEDVKAFSLSSWGIPEPVISSLSTRSDAINNGDLDFIITPGVAFDRFNHRVGHGKGYYDAFFAQYADINKGKKKPVYVGIGFNCQLIDCVPNFDHDVTLDRVIVGKQDTEKVI